MKILVVSDTHGMDEHFDEVLIRETPFDLLIHCGDVEGREDYIETVAECPVYMVAGNNDYYSDLPAEEVISLETHRIFLTHGHYYGVSWDLDKVVAAAISRRCDIVMFGHSHKPEIEKVGNILCMNPGSLTYPRQKGRRPSYIVMDMAEDGGIHTEIRYL